MSLSLNFFFQTLTILKLKDKTMHALDRMGIKSHMYVSNHEHNNNVLRGVAARDLQDRFWIG
jgi:hypothetical protein